MEGIDHLSAGVVCQQNYQKTGPRVSAADFILGVEMEGNMLGREEVKTGADDMEMEGDTLGREEMKAGADDVIGFMLGREEVGSEDEDDDRSATVMRLQRNGDNNANGDNRWRQHGGGGGGGGGSGATE